MFIIKVVQLGGIQNMKTQKKHPIFTFVNLPLTSDLFNSIIDSDTRWNKNLAVIYSFQKGKDLYIGRTINLRSRLKEHWTSPLKKLKKIVAEFYTVQ